MIELMIAVAMLGIVVPAILMLFSNVVQGFRADDAQNQLKKVNQETLLHFYMTLGRNKRIFTAGAPTTTLAGRLDMTACPSVNLTSGANKFPLVDVDASLDPKNSAFVGSEWGNMLLLLVNEGRISCAPVTNKNSTVMTFQVDYYRFYFYYLDRSQNNTSLTGGKSSRLVEWRSEPLADYGQLSNALSQDVTLASSVIQCLRNLPVPNTPVTAAVDPSASNPSSILYNLMPSNTLSVDGVRKIAKDWAPAGAMATKGFRFITNPQSSVLNGGFRYGIHPNTDTWSQAVAKVPCYAAESGDFPGGFEVGVVGTTNGREVFIRQVLAAQGAFGAKRNVISAELSTDITCRDIY